MYSLLYHGRMQLSLLLSFKSSTPLLSAKSLYIKVLIFQCMSIPAQGSAQRCQASSLGFAAFDGQSTAQANWERSFPSSVGRTAEHEKGGTASGWTKGCLG